MDKAISITKPGSLKTWLDYLEGINPNKIELGLSRVKTVFDRLNLDHIKQAKIVEVAGTNGKGSSAALIAASLNLSGIKTGLYTSPHLHAFTERVNIGGVDVNEETLCKAFAIVHNAAKEVSLTYFEYTTLAAFVCFELEKVDALVLEIGLGGRLDAVNVLDADIALICSIGLDHTHILGNTIEKIAYEKAGIIKDHSYVVTGLISNEAKKVILQTAKAHQSNVYFAGEAFTGNFEDGFTYTHKNESILESYVYPYPKVPYCVAPSVLRVLTLLKELGLKITSSAVTQAIKTVSLPGRMQLVKVNPTIYLDVAHNPPAAQNLVKTVAKRQKLAKRIAVIGMLKDKDIESVLSIIKDSFDEFYVASLHTERGENCERLKKALLACNIKEPLIKSFDNVDSAINAVLKVAKRLDEIIVLGSFVTVSEAMDSLKKLGI